MFGKGAVSTKLSHAMGRETIEKVHRLAAKEITRAIKSNQEHSASIE